MNQFLNPLTSIQFIKNLISDPGRLQRLNTYQINKYRDKALRKIINYAYTVPFYHKKYKNFGVHPNDIKSIKDIKKLPLVTKKELREHFPNDTIPNDYRKNKFYPVFTSGSTGKPLSFYTDFSTLAKTTGTTLRILNNLDLHWKKSRCAHILNFSSGNINATSDEVFVSKVRSFFSLKNHLLINTFDQLKEIIIKLDNFKPDMIVSYPTTFQHLAFLKKKGYGKDINPKVLLVGGYVLDEYTKRYVEDVFGCRMLNVYASAESSADIAFECMHGTWHINFDFFHLEAIDESNELVDPGEKGRLVLTRLFGKGTPIIRYTGMDDWITLLPEYECSCGLNTPIIKNGVEGRVSTCIVLPNGKVIPFGLYTVVSRVLNDLKTYKVKQFQIVQKKIDEIEILLVIDEDLRDIGSSVDIISKKILEAFEKKVGKSINIEIKEVKQIKSQNNKPPSLVVTHLDPTEIYNALEFKS